MAPRSEHVGYKFSLEEAKRKCSELNSCFVRILTTEHIGLHPRNLGCVAKGVKEELKSKLMKYSDILQGVPVNYEGIKIQQRTGSILDELPYIHFDVRVNSIVFKPTIGSTLVGIVNKIGVDYVGCLVHNCFNASITKSNFKNGLIYESLDIGSEFSFKVIGTEAVNGVLAIIGEVEEQNKKTRKRIQKDTEKVREKLNDESSQPEEGTELSLESIYQNGINDTDGNTKAKKKKKAHKHSREKKKKKK